MAVSIHSQTSVTFLKDIYCLLKLYDSVTHCGDDTKAIIQTYNIRKN